MKLTKISGEFDLDDQNRINKDLQNLIDQISKKLDYQSLITFAGFDEIEYAQTQFEQDLKNESVTFHKHEGYYILEIKSKNDLASILKQWALYAGGAGYFKLVASQSLTIEQIKTKNIEIISAKVNPDDFYLTLTDTSDGDKNLFELIEY